MPARTSTGRTVAAATGAVAVIAAVVVGGYAGGQVLHRLIDEPDVAAGLDVGLASLSDPMTCLVEHRGDPTAPDVLTVICDDAALSLDGPWVDREMRRFATGDEGWRITQGAVVGGEARLWLRSDTLDCVASRDLLDSTSTTEVRCHELETAPQPPPAEDTGPTTIQA